MTSYLLRAKHEVVIQTDLRPSPKEVTDWLERTLGTKHVQMDRISDTILEFRSPFRPFQSSKEFLRSVSGGELEVESGPGGPIIVLRANPRLWQSLIPVMWLLMYFGWTGATAVLRWGAGIGGVIAGGVTLFLIWGGMNSFLSATGWTLRMLRSGKQPPGLKPGA